jgi:hypothetical protein
MYAAREEIYPRETDGRYARLRWLFVWLTQLAFYCTPWLQWNGRQACCSTWARASSTFSASCCGRRISSTWRRC